MYNSAWAMELTHGSWQHYSSPGAAVTCSAPLACGPTTSRSASRRLCAHGMMRSCCATAGSVHADCELDCCEYTYADESPSSPCDDAIGPDPVVARGASAENRSRRAVRVFKASQ